MLAEYKTKTNIGIGLGIVMMAVGRILLIKSPESPFAIIFALLSIVGFIAWIYGCVSYAKGKGRSGWLGGVLAFLGLIGLLILFILKDKHKEA